MSFFFFSHGESSNHVHIYFEVENTHPLNGNKVTASYPALMTALTNICTFQNQKSSVIGHLRTNRTLISDLLVKEYLNCAKMNSV